MAKRHNSDAKANDLRLEISNVLKELQKKRRIENKQVKAANEGRRKTLLKIEKENRLKELKKMISLGLDSYNSINGSECIFVKVEQNKSHKYENERVSKFTLEVTFDNNSLYIDKSIKILEKDNSLGVIKSFILDLLENGIYGIIFDSENYRIIVDEGLLEIELPLDFESPLNILMVTANECAIIPNIDFAKTVASECPELEQFISPYLLECEDYHVNGLEYVDPDIRMFTSGEQDNIEKRLTKRFYSRQGKNPSKFIKNLDI